MVIDFHTHIFPPRIKENREHYLQADPLFRQLYASPKAHIATAEEVISSMERDGVDLAVVLNIGWSSQSLCQETNDYILEAVARYSQRLVGFAAVQPRAGEGAAKEIERCARAGIKGVGELRPDSQGFDLANPTTTEPIWEVMRKHRLILLLHTSEPVGHIYPGKGRVTPEAVFPFIQSHPDLSVVCAHWGGGLPFYALMPEVAAALANTYFDTAASSFLYRTDIYRYVTELIGADKVLFGSDFPLMAQARLLRELRSLPLPEKTKELILGGNALRLLGEKG